MQYECKYNMLGMWCGSLCSTPNGTLRLGQRFPRAWETIPKLVFGDSGDRQKTIPKNTRHTRYCVGDIGDRFPWIWETKYRHIHIYIYNLLV